ncbi:hypothetical protein HQ571_05855 [Candidatus Kuenenbacteria bacterium]|nr:hypothetical protein [Candidatus Kuenenbacteria bacterium]
METFPQVEANEDGNLLAEVQKELSRDKPEPEVEKITKKDKKLVDQIRKLLPPEARLEITQALKNNIALIKELGGHLKGGFDFKNMNKKKALALGAYLMVSFGSSAAFGAEAEHSSEGGEDSFELNSTQGLQYFKTALIERVDAMKPVLDSVDNGKIFIEEAIATYKDMSAKGASKIMLDTALDQMQNATIELQDADADEDLIRQTLHDIGEIYSGDVESDKAELEKQNEELAEPVNVEKPVAQELEFNEKYSAYEKTQIQEYYDFSVEIIDEMEDELNSYKLKYGNKPNYPEFEKVVMERISTDTQRLNRLADNVKAGEADVKAYVVGTKDAELVAESILLLVDSQVRLRTIQERGDDAFAEM